MYENRIYFSKKAKRFSHLLCLPDVLLLFLPSWFADPFFLEKRYNYYN